MTVLSVIAELADVMRSIAFGPPARPVAYRDVKPAGVFDSGDLLVGDRVPRTPAGRLSAVLVALQAGAITEATARDIMGVEPYVPPGLVPCPTCGTEQAPRDGRMAVHFATREATVPCVGSWPAKVPR